MDNLHEIAIMPHLWIVPLGAVIIGLVGVALIVFTERDHRLNMMGGWQVIGAVISGVAGAVLLTWVLMLTPFQSKYHVLYEVDGTIESVTNAFTSGSGDLTSSPVVRLDSLDRAVAVSDPRVLDLKGQDVTLLCSIEWVPYGLDRLNCSIAAIK